MSLWQSKNIIILVKIEKSNSVWVYLTVKGVVGDTVSEKMQKYSYGALTCGDTP